METVLVEEKLTGVAWALVHGPGEQTVGSAGLKDARDRTDFTVDTRFHVGSVTKSLLATGILRMVSQGLIELDLPVSRYIPKIPFANPWEDERPVTIRHLLDHTSGLNDAHLWQMFSERPTPDTPLIDAFPDPQRQLRVRSRPGARFSYSNMGYALLGMVIESVTGERYETYLDKQLLDPLGMDDSTFAFTTQEGASADDRLAWGHVDDGSRVAASPIFLRPAGQFTSTAHDLARFAGFLLGNGTLEGEPFISENLMRVRGRPYGTEAAAGGLLAGYALGLGRRDRHGVVGFCHGGNIVGFVAMVCIYPDEHKAFAYSVNTDSETADYGQIESALVRALDVAPAPSPETVPASGAMTQWYGRYILSPNRFETFRYLDTVFGAIKVSADDGHLVMTSLQGAPRALRPVEARIFSAVDRATASHIFLKGGKDEFLISDGFQTYTKVASTYLLAHWASVVLGLLGLGWLWSAAVVSLIRQPIGMLQRPEAPVFLAILALIVPVPFFLGQSFMALGDMTFASLTLAAVTLLVPAAALLTLGRAWRQRYRSRISLLHGFAAIFVLQWCAVLAAWNLLPLRLWS
ncbi:MAG: serine hydrolase domain-containing protein [Xanthomonadales bacterium]|nr:serine hydrolase domain-containing protein [Xanthomonadales bacterium]